MNYLPKFLYSTLLQMLIYYSHFVFSMERRQIKLTLNPHAREFIPQGNSPASFNTQIQFISNQPQSSNLPIAADKDEFNESEILPLLPDYMRKIFGAETEKSLIDHSNRKTAEVGNSTSKRAYGYEYYTLLEERSIQLNSYTKFQLKMEKSIVGKKVFSMIHYTMARKGLYFNFPNIPIPEDSNAFLNALDELIQVEQKWQHIQNSQSIIEHSYAYHQEHTNKFKKHTVAFTGQYHKFELEFLQDDKKEILLGISAIHKDPNISTKRKWLTLPLYILPWLRGQMAELLAKYDRTEPIEKEMSVQIPHKFMPEEKEIWTAKKTTFHDKIFSNPSESSNHPIELCDEEFNEREALSLLPDFMHEMLGIKTEKVSNSDCKIEVGSSNSKGYQSVDKDNNILNRRYLVLKSFNSIEKERLLELKFKKGESGKKFFRMEIKFYKSADELKSNSFTNIPIPEDFNPFVRALDELIKVEQKLQTQNPQLITKGGFPQKQQQRNEMTQLRSVEFTGLCHKFKFQLLLDEEIVFRISAVQNNAKNTKNKKNIILPLYALPWLRKQMVEMMAEFYGAEDEKEI